jgi:hypothetical protein
MFLQELWNEIIIYVITKHLICKVSKVAVTEADNFFFAEINMFNRNGLGAFPVAATGLEWGTLHFFKIEHYISL